MHNQRNNVMIVPVCRFCHITATFLLDSRIIAPPTTWSGRRVGGENDVLWLGEKSRDTRAPRALVTCVRRDKNIDAMLTSQTRRTFSENRFPLNAVITVHCGWTPPIKRASYAKQDGLVYQNYFWQHWRGTVVKREMNDIIIAACISCRTRVERNDLREEKIKRVESELNCSIVSSATFTVTWWNKAIVDIRLRPIGR